jgi:hypothetical protein
LHAPRRELLFGITGTGVVHLAGDNPDVDTRFAMVRDAGVFDYFDRTPPTGELDIYRRASEKYGLPLLAGGFFYTLGRDEPLLAWHLDVARESGTRVQNVQLTTRHASGRPITNDEVATAYLNAAELGDRLGVAVCFEVHVNMWSEHFGRVQAVADLVARHGVPFRMTLDASHVIFKIDNPEEQEVQEIQGLRADVEAGRVVLDPYSPASVSRAWIDNGLVGHAHARPAVPANPRNVWAKHPDGSVGRGIQYPFREPAPGTWHSPWREERLEPWKEVMRQLLRHHAADPASPLQMISTEIIPPPDYGGGARYSLFEDSIALAHWLRAEWAAAKDGATRATAASTTPG